MIWWLAALVFGPFLWLLTKVFPQPKNSAQQTMDIHQLKQQQLELKKTLAVAIADEKRYRKAYEQECSLAVEWEKKSKEYKSKGVTDLEAVTRQREHEHQARSFEQAWQDQKAAVERMKATLTRLNEGLDRASRERTKRKARENIEEAERLVREVERQVQDSF